MFKLVFALLLLTPFISQADTPPTATDTGQQQLFTPLAEFSASDFAPSNGNDANYEDFQRRRNPPGWRRPRHPNPPGRYYPPVRYSAWYFLGCTNTEFNCNWAATRYGFREYRAIWDIRCRRGMYACYGRNQWSAESDE